MTPSTITVRLAGLKNFLVDSNIAWRDRAIVIITALSFALSIIIKERGAIIALLLLPLLFFYPYGAAGWRVIIARWRSPAYLIFYGFLAVLLLSLVVNFFMGTVIARSLFIHAIFIHGIWVLGRVLLLMLVAAPLLWLWQTKPLLRTITLDLIAALSLGVMVLLIIAIETNHLTRLHFRNDQYSENVAILFLLLFPLMMAKNRLAWLCLPLIILLHAPFMTVGGWAIGYGTARLWTLALLIMPLIFFFTPWWQGWSRRARIFLFILLVILYIFTIGFLLVSGLIFHPTAEHPSLLLTLIEKIGYDSHSISERLKIWHFVGYYVAQDSWGAWLGHGMNIMRYLPAVDNNFSTHILGLIPFQADAQEFVYIEQPHFVWIELLLDGGVLALLLLLGFFAALLWLLMVNQPRHPATRASFAFFITFLLCFILTNSIYAFWQYFMGTIALLLLWSNTTPTAQKIKTTSKGVKT
ncbi:MAG: hypothetical protein ORN57_01420 [Alphaproteobacteria bacterium]|nr:hypothetical protein [Alphaproteobacteria bacterium]